MSDARQSRSWQSSGYGRSGVCVWVEVKIRAWKRSESTSGFLVYTWCGREMVPLVSGLPGNKFTSVQQCTYLPSPYAMRTGRRGVVSMAIAPLESKAWIKDGWNFEWNWRASGQAPGARQRWIQVRSGAVVWGTSSSLPVCKCLPPVVGDVGGPVAERAVCNITYSTRYTTCKLLPWVPRTAPPGIHLVPTSTSTDEARLGPVQ